MATARGKKVVGGPSESRRIRAVVKGVLQHVQEQKRFDVAIASVDISTGGLVQPITQHIIQGDSLTTRDGNTIVLKSLDVTWNAFDNGATGVNLYRFIIFRDLLNTGVLPAITEILASASPTAGYNVTNLNNGRFKILVDDQVGCVATASNAEILKRYRLKNMNSKVTYSGTTFTSGANGKNSLWIITVSDRTSAAATMNKINISMVFTDS